MTYRVLLSPHVVRAYKKFDPPTQALIRAGLEAVKQHPFGGPKVKRLKGRLREYYRYRAGDYRIVYAIDRRAHVVYVDYIQHRKDVYRG